MNTLDVKKSYTAPEAKTITLPAEQIIATSDRPGTAGQQGGWDNDQNEY